ncbi:T9SS type B sorting domain-containing protein [Psychroserpens algicola]|uniref:T9SS type B sorting domain-containing protein n=1 Tax=Psychroserpens algicola TaxID=1719034 RepID=A0ABT0HB68_9FLAO|nr:choice-of-anchor L domain-containing protein [Psychroserpens algicola]MCK8481613.1 T9SS type B sorting domain-containing protein [Psychroserpens algicola]
MTFLKKSLSLFACFLCCTLGAQQISIDNSFTEQELIENNLVQGCVETSNIESQINGQVNGFNSFAYFERAGSNFPFENGIMLSTGNAISGGNTENTAILNEGQPNWTTDPDLETALGITGTLNATSIEFDFISAANQIQFNYILASEEYFGNFPCEYSDGFAFLIKEAGTSDPYTNIAIIPGTTTPVNTNTIHDEIVGFCDASNAQYFEGFNLGDTNYNGRTTVMTASATIQPNVQYHIKLVIADQTDRNYDSAVFIEGNSFNASVDLGSDIQTCADEVTLDGNIENPQATYAWFLNNVLIGGATQPTLNVSQSGDYRVEVEIPLAGSTCLIEDAIVVTLSSTQSAEPISDYELCDDLSGDETEVFDLSTKDSDVIASVPASNYSISYHTTANDAQTGTNAVSGTFQNTSNPQTIFVRIEDATNGCLAFQNFDLIVNPLPVITTPTLLLVCDDATADGFTTIDLSQKDDEITNGNFDLEVTYHYTQNDADNGINAIPLPYVNTNTTETLFVNVSNVNTGCSITTTLDIEVLNNPVINTENHYIDACDSDHDGFATFDLTSIIDDVLEGLTGVSVTFHETQEDADLGINPIADETNYANTVSNEQVVFIRVEDNNTGCASTTPIEVHTNLLLTATNIRDFAFCDEDNDGVEEFNLSNIAEIFIDDVEDVMEYDIAIEFYETEDDRNNQINPIDQTVPFTPSSNPQTIYITLTSPNCQEISQFDLIINPIIEFPPIDNQTVCDTDQDGLTTIDLSQFDILVTNNLTTDFTVSYYATEEDANSGSNALPTLYSNTSNPLTVYTRIAENLTACADINSFNIEVLPAPLSNQPTDIIICDDDQDAVSIIDLDAKISEIVSDTTNRVITFHTTLNDADTSSNAIGNTAAYPASTNSLFVRIENTITGCYTTESFEVIVNTLPNFTAISNYKICEDFSDGIGDFIFETKDIEILNGQTGKEVLYFLNQSDADANTNAIDKTSVYQNSSNPQTIIARVQNITDTSCYGTASFTIEVGTNPEYNVPVDWFVCDDISNDGSESFDLNLKVQEISEGINDNLDITFYTSLSDAENLTNALPLQYTNTLNPQRIFAVIDNGTICNAITSFELNVIQSPDANPASPISMCDEDYDGIVVFDLTQAEFDILDVRQDDITVTYFETTNDLESNTNAISDPSQYTNLTNPQTVFIRVTNTISDCFVSVPLELDVNLPPAIHDFETYDICDTATQTTDLTEINSSLLDQTANVLVNYYASETDARNQENALDTIYTYQTTNDTLFARVEFSTTHCFTIYEFNLQVNPLPIANQPNNIEACDDDFDGFYVFDLSEQNAQILGGQNPNAFTVSYYLDDILAEEGLDPLEATYEAMTNETIYARVENNTTGCYSITEFLTVVFEKPVVDIEDQVICLDNLPLIVSANTNNAGDTYLWSTNEITPEIEITDIGTYSVTVTSVNGCETTRVFTVSESEAAIIEITETVDFSDPNNITVTVSGIGNYLYQLDDNEPQESSTFENVSLGYHTITIIDLNGCSEVSKEIVVIDAPKFFTPNNDSYFDTWHITGVETLTGTIVYIYDRYGKLLKTLDSNDKGWDGFYNGHLMPANDYWFVADVRKNNISFQVKGHFSLRL